MHCGCDAPFIGPSLADSCYGGSFVLFMSILDTFIRNECDLSEICQRVKPKLHPDPEYDFVVIGGGSGGSVVAARLSEVPHWKVLLIEAGGDEPPGSQVPSMASNFIANPPIDWGYKTEPQERACLGYPERRCTWPRGKVLGGCSTINGMMYVRGLPKDYDSWETMGNPGWSYNNVLPYFIKSEGNQQIGSLVSGDYHGSDGPLTVSRFSSRPLLADDMMMAANELGYLVVDDLNVEPFTGFTIAQATIKNGSRLSSARAFLRPARNRPNLHIMLNSTVTKILLNNTNNQKKASRVQFVFKNQTYTVNVKREVILSAGTINTPHILLLSGIGSKEKLDKVNIQQTHNLPGVGQNLQNHVSFSLSFHLKYRRAINDLNWLRALRYLRFRKDLMSSTGMAQVTGRINSKYADPSGSYPDLQIFFAGYSAHCSRSGLLTEAEDPNNPSAPKIIQISPVVLRPKSRGCVGLRSDNSFDPPLMNPNYLTEEYDVKVLIEGIRIAQKLAGTTVLRETYGVELIREKYGNCSEIFKFDSNDFWECAVRYSTIPENHQSGSCKMGSSSDSLAVVDSKLQVHGIGGLRVMDASIFPSGPSGNTQSSVLMAAEKGVDYIKQKWLIL